MSHHHDRPETAEDAAAFWEDFYAPGRRPWSGRPNPLLTSELTQRPPPGPRRLALDVGCGQGDDAIWLARRGWTVTGVDIAAAALEHAASRATAAGVGHRTSWVRADLTAEFPVGAWDLVTATYLHSPVGFDRDEVLRRAAAVVSPGGTLIVLGHQCPPSWVSEPPEGVHFPTAGDVVAAIGADGWVVERAEAVGVPLSAPDGKPGTRVDNVVRLRRPTPLSGL